MQAETCAAFTAQRRWHWHRHRYRHSNMLLLSIPHAAPAACQPPARPPPSHSQYRLQRAPAYSTAAASPQRATTGLRRRATRTTSRRELPAWGEAGGGPCRSSSHHPILSRNAKPPFNAFTTRRPRAPPVPSRRRMPVDARWRQQRFFPQHMSAGANSDGADDQPSIVSGMKTAGWHARRAPTCRPTAARERGQRRRRGCCRRCGCRRAAAVRCACRAAVDAHGYLQPFPPDSFGLAASTLPATDAARAEEKGTARTWRTGAP